MGTGLLRFWSSTGQPYHCLAHWVSCVLPRPGDCHFSMLWREGGESGRAGCQGRLQNLEAEVWHGTWSGPPGGCQDYTGKFFDHFALGPGSTEDRTKTEARTMHLLRVCSPHLILCPAPQNTFSSVCETTLHLALLRLV